MLDGSLTYQLPAPFTWGIIKGIVLRHIRWFTQKESVFNRDGTLSIGWSYPCAFLSEVSVSAGTLPHVHTDCIPVKQAVADRAGLQLGSISLLGSQVFPDPRAARVSPFLDSQRRGLSIVLARKGFIPRSAVGSGVFAFRRTRLYAQLGGEYKLAKERWSGMFLFIQVSTVHMHVYRFAGKSHLSCLPTG